MLLDVALLKELADGLVDVAPPDVLWHYTTISAAKPFSQLLQSILAATRS